MTRLPLLLAPLALLAGGAGPSQNAPLTLAVTQGLTSTAGFSGQVQRQARPDNSAAAMFTPAPTPNVDLRPPPPPNAPSQASVGPGLFQPKNQYHGEGYVAGSTVQVEQERKIHLTPGINLRVPLQ